MIIASKSQSFNHTNNRKYVVFVMIYLSIKPYKNRFPFTLPHAPVFTFSLKSMDKDSFNKVSTNVVG